MTRHMIDSMTIHECGGVILSSGGEGEYDHYYCRGCGAYTYDPDPGAPFPTGTDPVANREAHDNGDYRSPDAEGGTERYCECGDLFPDTYTLPCENHAPEADMVLVEGIPEYLRAAHTAAGNRGSWPANGAVRAHVHPECVAWVLEDADGWVEVVD